MSILQATCEYKRVKNCSIRADVFLPSVRNPPVVIHFHGGALISGSRKYLPGYQARRLIQAGFAVVSFDYRLAPETKLPEIISDIQDAIHWARNEGARTFSWDDRRMAVMGNSAGGYLSLMTGTFQDKPKAIVSFYGYGDILGEWYTRPSEFYSHYPIISKEEAEASIGRREKSTGGNRRYTYYFYTRQQGSWPQAVSGYHPVADRPELLKFCPVYNVTPVYPPTLFLHGDQDTDVPHQQSVHMAEALRKQDIAHQLITVKGAGHGFDGDLKYPGMGLIFDEVIEFLHNHINK